MKTKILITLCGWHFIIDRLGEQTCKSIWQALVNNLQKTSHVTVLEDNFMQAELWFESNQFDDSDDAAHHISQRLCNELNQLVDTSLVRCSDIQVSAQTVPHASSSHEVMRANKNCVMKTLYSDSATELNDILSNNRLEPYWQSIQHVQSEGLFGYEALIRGPFDSSLHRADKLFDAALANGQQDEVELHALQTHLNTHTAVCSTQKPCMLTVNISPKLLFSEHVTHLLHNHAFPEYICLELTEHVPVNDWASLQEKMTSLRQLGYQIWLDDVGCGFFELETINIAKPDVAKLCITIISQLPNNQHIISELKKVIQAVHQYGGKVLAEGIEHENQLSIAKSIGVDLAQGYFFDKPSPVKIPD
ncbi:EAL domain-containing protein [Pseudoalteromonas luteoviolacea]|uniref:EAL domain-containing protein n=1 Tax=Pseudoalteromonas luteoviolacea TaxID=43657 RepID=UPI001B3A431E|nr:EAL domain-containing protein [Pseudoalteromonas luteoviolacea]MBQ4878264.1 EAL domain-containing protein [Pseudoalteromonas luteoviolacea]MBQ4907419.1 EAL domain-containing protein [Pseudoalteromonas luteoviolacea]